MHSSLPHYFSQLQLSSISEMSSNAITILYQPSGAEHPSFSIKTQLGNSCGAVPWQELLLSLQPFASVSQETYLVRALVKT